MNGKIIARRPYRDDIELSTIGFGGIVVVNESQDEANAVVREAIDRGVNYFDVAPTYGNGEAEEKLGIALEGRRDDVFVACKTPQRKADDARRELEGSLAHLKTDRFDLYQFHAVSTMEDVDTILGPGGAAELFLDAKREGKVRHLGFSAHSVEAAIALMDRAEFTIDSILFPFNMTCWAQGDFGPQVLEHARRKGIARLALKALAHHRRPRGHEKKWNKCWYVPVDERALAEQALRFTLSQEVTAAIPPGEKELFRLAMDIAADFEPMPADEQQRVLDATDGLEPIFARK